MWINRTNYLYDRYGWFAGIRRLQAKIMKKLIFFSSEGFTLLELLITLAILLLVSTGLLLGFISCIFLNETNTSLIIAANDAQFVLEQLKSSPYDQINNYTVPLSFNYTLNNETINLTRQVGTRLANITVEVDWNERTRPRNFQISTRIAK
jgi:prepilin-type N-terminal cleavage/methylation domain-containing protein